MLKTEPIERQVMQLLLAGDHPTLDVLRQQFAHCLVAEREFTGMGFFTTFEVPSGIPKIESRVRIFIGDVCAEVDDLGYGCGFTLFVDDGVIETLECHLWGDDAFPSNPRYNRVYYIHQPNPPAVAETEERDTEALTTRLANK
jgi:hypothetical protein